MNSNDKRLAHIIHRACYDGALDRFSYAEANAALQFFVRLSDRVDQMSVATVQQVAELRREYPADWQGRATATHFRRTSRRVVTEINPIPELPRRLGSPPWVDRIERGHFPYCADNLPDHCIDLLMTSPPYAMRRAANYDSISEEEYPAYTVAWMRQVKRLLKPSGSVAIIIKAHSEDGVEKTYVRRTVDAVEADGWKLIQTLAWYKANAAGVGRQGRPRPSFELMYWFALSNDPFCDPLAAGRPSKRVGRTNGRSWLNQRSGEIHEGIARVRDVIVTSGSGSLADDKLPHPAKHPVELYQKIIQLLSPPRGVILDPFIGSGTAAAASVTTGRRYIGFDTQQHYVAMARGRVKRLRQRPAVHSNHSD